MPRPIYLDSAATTQIDPEVEEVMLHYMREEFGNAGSRTHEYGTKAKQAVQKARGQIANIVECKTDEVIFTSGATESNNIAILGLRKFGEENGKKHIVSTAIEHRAVLEPLEHLKQEYGFEIELVKPEKGGAVNAEEVFSKVRPDTLLVSVMHVNNETGIIQPIEKIAELLENHEAFFHVDAAQSFGKLIKPLHNRRIDLISISGHKIYGPKGIGALVNRRRKYRRLPLTPITFGGGQEYGLRPGTLPVHLCSGLGEASQLAANHVDERRKSCEASLTKLSELLKDFQTIPIGNNEKRLYCFMNLQFKGLDSETVILLLKDKYSVSNGSACTSSTYDRSHVLDAMNIEPDVSSIRISCSHLTEII